MPQYPLATFHCKRYTPGTRLLKVEVAAFAFPKLAVGAPVGELTTLQVPVPTTGAVPVKVVKLAPHKLWSLPACATDGDPVMVMETLAEVAEQYALAGMVYLKVYPPFNKLVAIAVLLEFVVIIGEPEPDTNVQVPVLPVLPVS